MKIKIGYLGFFILALSEITYADASFANCPPGETFCVPAGACIPNGQPCSAKISPIIGYNSFGSTSKSPLLVKDSAYLKCEDSNMIIESVEISIDGVAHLQCKMVENKAASPSEKKK